MKIIIILLIAVFVIGISAFVLIILCTPRIKAVIFLLLWQKDKTMLLGRNTIWINTLNGYREFSMKVKCK